MICFQGNKLEWKKTYDRPCDEYYLLLEIKKKSIYIHMLFGAKPCVMVAVAVCCLYRDIHHLSILGNTGSKIFDDNGKTCI